MHFPLFHQNTAVAFNYLNVECVLHQLNPEMFPNEEDKS